MLPCNSLNLHRDFSRAKILVLGMGQIGKRTLDNLVAEKGAKNIFIANWSIAKTLKQATLYDVHILDWDEAFTRIGEFDAIVSAVSAPRPVFTKSILSTINAKCIVDLSIPFSVADDNYEEQHSGSQRGSTE